jgi:hypothetical protein
MYRWNGIDWLSTGENATTASFACDARMIEARYDRDT